MPTTRSWSAMRLVAALAASAHRRGAVLVPGVRFWPSSARASA